MKEFLLRGTHDRDFDYMVNTKSFMSHKWADADLVFFDSTLFNTYVDEGACVAWVVARCIFAESKLAA